MNSSINDSELCKRKSFRVLFFIKKSRLLKNGEAPIRLRITYNKQCVEIQIKRSVPMEQWSQSKERSIGKGRMSVELNAYLDAIRIKLYRIQQQMELNEELITAKIIQNKFLGTEEAKKTLHSIFKEHNDKCRKLIGTEYSAITVNRYDNCLKYLMETVRRYKRKEDILLKEIDTVLVRDFEFYLQSERGCAPNTIIRYMKCFKKITNMAIANDWIRKDPFATVHFREEEVHKEFLTMEEIELMSKKCFEIPRLTLVRDIFLFCCWSGLAFIDVQQLKPEHIIKDNNGALWIHKCRQKTNNMCNVPLLSPALRILDKYKDNPICKEKRMVFPVMCNQKMNSYLKEIADLCGIRKNITMHTGRHTFATVIALANNVSLENVAKMLGHSNTKMTQRYAKVLDQSIMRDMMNVEKQISI